MSSERARKLMALVVALRKGGDVTCSSTQITEQGLLTAAHCVAGGSAPSSDGGEVEEMVCLHDGSCAEPFPVGEIGAVSRDLATLRLKAPRELAEQLTLGALDGDLPTVFLLSARLGDVRAVCRASAASGLISSTDAIERADSGSALVAFDSADAAWIVGVVSHREEGTHDLIAATIPQTLPWGSAWSEPHPQVITTDRGQFQSIQECPQ